MNHIKVTPGTVLFVFIILFLVSLSCSGNGKQENELRINPQASTADKTTNVEPTFDELLENLPLEAAMLEKRKQFTSLPESEQIHGTVVYLPREKAVKKAEELFDADGFEIEILSSDNTHPKWKELSKRFENWKVLDGFQHTRPDGYTDYHFAVQPVGKLIGAPVLKFDDDGRKSKLVDGIYFLHFAGDSQPLVRNNGKKIVRFDLGDIFYASNFHKLTPDIQSVLIKLTEKKPLSPEESELYRQYADSVLAEANSDPNIDREMDAIAGRSTGDDK
ncbi:MAG: hypothetical protein GXO92_01405 [FCB group bacterium]|nr:hypothetical protein [FCB group bacterium]